LLVKPSAKVRSAPTAQAAARPVPRQLLQEETHRVGLQLVPGLTKAINHDEALFCPDGVHTNDAGHAALADSIEPHLRAVEVGTRVR